eukprot:TRINITY_DN2101_c0_g1_i1.p1 TRINITY_DN2101_c0_g1~~TRINITY_DN2101_c0_g1_i1.p1  ORF type:complete len:239 (+),score=28.14 TRINITY_DN2101_c0_g1_i1:574-1290(+)
MKIQLAVAGFKFMDATVLLFRCSKLLDMWHRRLGALEVSSQSDRQSARRLMTWHQELLRALTLKTGLYFRGPLQRFASTEYRSSHDLHLLVESFVAKSAAVAVCLGFDASGAPWFSSDGYRVPYADEEGASGMRNWPVVYNHPAGDVALAVWPAVVSLLLQNSGHWRKSREPLYCEDKLPDKPATASYWLVQVEPQVYVSVIFNRKKESDKATLAFLAAFCGVLRFSSIYASMRKSIQ